MGHGAPPAPALSHPRRPAGRRRATPAARARRRATPARPRPAVVPHPPSVPAAAVSKPEPDSQKTESVVRKGFAWKFPWFGKKDTDGAVAVSDEPDSAEFHKYPFVDLQSVPIDRTMGLTLPENAARAIQGVCIGRPTDHDIVVAVKDPTQVYVYDNIAIVSHGKLTPSLVRADPALLDLAHEYIYKVNARFHQVDWLEWLQKKKYQADEVSLVQSEATEASGGEGDLKGPAIEAVDRLIKEAISMQASDVHVETDQDEIVLRYRIRRHAPCDGDVAAAPGRIVRQADQDHGGHGHRPGPGSAGRSHQPAPVRQGIRPARQLGPGTGRARTSSCAS